MQRYTLFVGKYNSMEQVDTVAAHRIYKEVHLRLEESYRRVGVSRWPNDVAGPGPHKIMGSNRTSFSLSLRIITHEGRKKTVRH